MGITFGGSQKKLLLADFGIFSTHSTKLVSIKISFLKVLLQVYDEAPIWHVRLHGWQ